MTLIWNIIQSVITILEIRVCVWMMEKFAEPRYSGKKQKIVVWIVTLGVGGLYAYNRWVGAYYSRLMLLTIIGLLCLSVIFLFRYYRSVAVFVLSNYLLIGGLIDVMIMGIVEIAMRDPQFFGYIEYVNNIYRVSVIVLSKVLLFLCCWLIYRQLNKTIICQLNEKKIGFICVVLCLIEYVGMHIFSEILNAYLHVSYDFLISLMLYLTVIVLMIFIMGITILYYEKKEQLKQKNIFLESLDCENKRMIRLYREREIMYHDFKNHLIALDDFAQRGDLKQFQSYMENVREPFVQKPKEWKSGHDIIDLILNYKVREARKRKIQVKCTIFGYVNFVLDITDEEICSLMGNLWDNAIEACERYHEGEPEIDFQMHIKPGKILIEISNSCQGVFYNSNGEIQTTKEHKQFHGIGMRTIRDITERYRGYFNCVMYDHVFKVEVMICNNR